MILAANRSGMLLANGKMIQPISSNILELMWTTFLPNFCRTGDKMKNPQIPANPLLAAEK